MGNGGRLEEVTGETEAQLWRRGRAVLETLGPECAGSCSVPPPSLSIPVGSGHHRQRQPRSLWENEAIPWRSLAGISLPSRPRPRRAAVMGQGQAGQAWGVPTLGGLPVQGQEPKGAVWSLYTVWG